MTRRSVWCVVALAGAGLALGTGLGAAAAEPEVLDEPEAARQVVVEDVRVDGARISGTVVNRTPNEVREVRLLVRYIFQWHDEFHPGGESPGHAAVVPVEGTVAPGGSVAFSYAPPQPLPERDDGFYEPRVELLGFSEIEPAPGG